MHPEVTNLWLSLPRVGERLEEGRPWSPSQPAERWGRGLPDPQPGILCECGCRPCPGSAPPPRASQPGSEPIREAAPSLATGPVEAAPSVATTDSSVTSGQRPCPFLPVRALWKLPGGGGCHLMAHIPRAASSTGRQTATTPQPWPSCQRAAVIPEGRLRPLSVSISAGRGAGRGLRSPREAAAPA